jgi:hypothetical protein
MRSFGLVVGVLVALAGVSVGGLAVEGRSTSTNSFDKVSSTIGYNFPVSDDTTLEEVTPAVAYNDDREEYLVVWYNDRPGNDDIRAQRVSKNGVLVGGPFYISAGDGAERRYPDVAYNIKDQQYLVVWEHYESASGNSIHARRVSSTGVVLDANDLVVRSAGANLYTPSSPAVAYAYTANKYLVVWQETWHPMPISKSIESQAVLSSGALDGNIETISQDSGGNYREVPDLAYNRRRNEYLVVWQQLDKGAGITDIYGRRVTGDGAPLLPEAIEIMRVTTSQFNPRVAAIRSVDPEGKYLVVWELEYAPGDKNIYARPVSGDGAAGSGFYVAWTAENETKPAVAGSEDSLSYTVTWTRPSDPPIVFIMIEGRDVSPTGDLGEIASFGGLSADHSDLATGPTGDVLVAFQDLGVTPSAGIYAQLWGERIYIPLVVR